MKYLIAILLVLTASAVSAQENNFTYDDHGKRDPLERLVTPDGVILNYGMDITISDLTLEGIVVGANGSNLAIINGNVLKKNDMFGPFHVFVIDEDFVILEKDKQEFELKLKKE